MNLPRFSFFGSIGLPTFGVSLIIYDDKGKIKGKMKIQIKRPIRMQIMTQKIFLSCLLMSFHCFAIIFSFSFDLAAAYAATPAARPQI